MSILATPVLSLLLAASVAQATAPEAAQAGAGDLVTFEEVTYRDRVEASGEQTRTWQTRVVLRSAAAVREFGQIAYAYVDGYGEVVFESVELQKADGRRVEVKSTSPEDVNPYGVTNTSMSADVRFKKLTIPGIEVGDTLSFRVVCRQRPLAPGHAFGSVKLPLIVGEPSQVYELDLPRSAPIRVRLRDGLGATWQELPAAPDRLVRRLRVQVKAPDPKLKKATKRMAQQWAEPDVQFSSFTGWDEVSRWWWALSRDRAAPDAGVRAQAQALLAGPAGDRDKLSTLHDFVASKIRYLNVGFGIGRMQPRPAAQVLDSRYGDCKDAYALLAALATAAGVDVRPVLVNRSGEELRDDVPAPQQFDHVLGVARLSADPSSWLWLDPTSRYGVAGYLAADLRGRRGLLVEPSGEARLVKTPDEPPFVPRLALEIKGGLQPDGSLRARSVWTMRSDAELLWRTAFDATPQDRRVEAVKGSFARAWKDATVKNLSLGDTAATAQPFRVEFDAEQAAPGDVKGDWSFAVPLPDFGLAEADDSPDADPLEFDERDIRFRAEIALPDGLEARAPLSITLDRPFGRFESVYAVEGRALKISRSLTIASRSLARDDIPAYEAMRKAVEKDRDQKFIVTGLKAASASGGGSAESLRKDGVAALDRKDYAAAIELLRMATAADAKVKDGFLDLGRALHSAGREDEALEAFAKQIEVAPFHEHAYAWRATVLDRLGRSGEAEKDLLKQIEVAPFQVWSYETLAWRYTRARRFSNAADLYARAAAVQPDKAGRWVDAAWAYARDGRAAEARTALERARTLDPADWMKISAAGVYALIGDHAAAAEIANDGLTAVSKRLAALSADSFGDDDLWGAQYLARGWYAIGAAALAAGDQARGERYLTAAWRLGMLPEAGWALGELREKQGRLREAVDLWTMADRAPEAEWKLPANRLQRIEEAFKKLPPPSSPVTVHGRLQRPPGVSAEDWRRLDSPAFSDAGARLTRLRTVALPGSVLGDLAQSVILLRTQDGLVERLRPVATPKNAASYERQLTALGTLRLPRSAPDERPFKVAQKALLVCSRVSSCSLIVDLPD